MTPELKLLLKCCQTHTSSIDELAIKRALLDGIDWTRFAQLAIDHGVMTLAGNTLMRVASDTVPEDILGAFQKNIENARKENAAKFHEIASVLGALAKDGVEGILLSGPAVAIRTYGDPGLRLFRSQRFLVRNSDLAPANAILLGLGYRQNASYTTTQLDLIRWLEGREVFVKRLVGDVIQAQSRLTPRRMTFDIDDCGLWSRSQRLLVDGKTVRMLAAEDMFILLAIHGGMELWRSMILASDVAALVASHQDLDWPAILERAKSQKCLRAVLLATSLARQCFGATIPGEMITAECSDRQIAPMARRIWENWGDRPATSSTNYASPLIEELRLLDTAADRIGYLLRIFFLPSTADVRSTRLPSWLTFGYFPLKLFHHCIASPLRYAAAKFASSSSSVEPLRQKNAPEKIDGAQAILHDPESPAAHADFAMKLRKGGDLNGSERAYRAALSLRADDVESLLGLGHVLKSLGRLDEAVKCYRTVSAKQPGEGIAWWSLANLKTVRFSAQEMSTMQELFGNANLPDSERLHIAYALGKACEDVQDHDAAFKFYKRGATLQRARVQYDPKQIETMADRIAAVFTQELFEQRAGSGHAKASPIFIVGMPRSGSTLVEQILASHSQVDGTREFAMLDRVATQISKLDSSNAPYPEAIGSLDLHDFKLLGEWYIGATARYRGTKAYFTDKYPENFSLVGLIALILPNAKIIDIRRHPMATCFANFKQYFPVGREYTYDLTELGQYYLQYHRIMRWWDEVLPGRVLRVEYEKLVNDPENQIRRLLDHCGLGFESECLSHYKTKRAVETPSSEQVRLPIYKSALGAWRPYKHHLLELEEQLAPLLRDLPPDIRDAGL